MMNTTQQILTALSRGMELSGYILDECIGSGSSGDVWRAYFGETAVAIKVMHLSLLKGKGRKLHFRRFRTEIESLRLMALEPSIPDLFEVNLTTVPPYFVMSHVRGQSFAEAIASGQMMTYPVKDRLMRLHKLASTLDNVHTMGLLHRDVKPANIRGWEQPYLLDFSIALPISAAQSANPHIGTQLYMPPYPDLGPSIFTDIYGFALVCYEVLFGRHALFALGETGETREELQQMGLHRLKHETWYRPSQMSAAELPIYLQGANLSALDNIFQKTLTDLNANGNAKTLIKALAKAIIVPENQTYLDCIPDITPLTVNGSYDSKIFTDHEVDIQARDTDLDAQVVAIDTKAVSLMMSAVGLIIFVVWLLLQFL
jgi:serine/threonine protein kinase